MIDFIQSETQFFILCLTTLFTLINPIGIAPLLMVMTERFSKDEEVKIARKGSATALITLLLFAILGSLIFIFLELRLKHFKLWEGYFFLEMDLGCLMLR